MKIQPIKTWSNGQAKEATQFELRSISDNLATSATFYYSLNSEEVSHMEEEVKVIDKPSQVVAEGNLSMDGEDYLAWGQSTDINAAAYVWGADKLNLVLVAE